MAHLTTRWHGDIAMVAPRGYLMGGDETDEMAATFASLLAQGNRKLIVDLIDVVHMNSTALGVIIGAYRRYEEAGGLVRLCHVNDRIENPLVITRLSLVFEVHATERDAIEAFQAPVG